MKTLQWLTKSFRTTSAVHSQEKAQLSDSRNISDLHPDFQPIVAEVLRRASGRGIYPFLISTRRSYAMQACLYAQGRVRPGEAGVFQGYTVVVTPHGNYVIAQCRGLQVRVPASEWERKVTNAQPLQSWHTLGFAADFAFHSSATARDARYDLALYRKLAELFKEVCPDVRWGNDWNGNGVEVDRDPGEHFSDIPHFEWHPGITVGEAAQGILPEHPKECHECGRFRDEFAGEVCDDCARHALPRAA
jgi:hypothetical protein